MHRGRAVQEALKARPGTFAFDDEEDDDLVLNPTASNSQQRSQDPNDQIRGNEYKRPRIAPSSSSQTVRPYSQPERSRYSMDQEELPLFNQRPYSTLPDPIMESYSMPSMTMAEMRERIRQLEEVKRKYDQLVDLRYTEAEKLYKEYQEAVTHQLQKSDDLVQALQRSLDERDDEIKELRAALERQNNERSNTQKQSFESLLDGESMAKEVSLLRSTVERLQKERNDALDSRKELLVQLARQNGPSNESVQRQIKDMQEDLTGLLITDVKDTKEGTVFNCIQTGRNGTIQFKLIQRSNDSNEMQYRPMLDPIRDSALMSALPPYLTFDIDFHKDKANLFYWKLSSALHSKP